MLKDDLYSIRQLGSYFMTSGVSGFHDSAVKISAACTGLAARWKTAVYSDSPDHSLKRYFTYHLEGIREISDTLFECHSHPGEIHQLQQELIALVDYQRKYFRKFFDADAVTPMAYYRNVADTLGAAVSMLTKELKATTVNENLKNCVLSYLNEMVSASGKTSFTFRALFYFESVTIGLHEMNLAKTAGNTEHLLSDKLSLLNFNHLGFFAFRREQILVQTDDTDPWKKLKKLQDELMRLKYNPHPNLCYDPCWPPLNEMLAGWLTEEIGRATASLHSQEMLLVEKLPLNVSMAQLAFLLKLLFLENIYHKPNLSQIFKFFSRNFETKRQKFISAGSLSKEYYSVNQVTAAVVRDLLLKMVSRINRDFFP